MPISKVVFGTNVLIDITDTTATEDHVLSGYVIHKADGSKVTGVAAANILNSDGESIEDDTLIINDGSGGGGNVPTGSSKNIQVYQGYDEVNSDSYTATDVSLTVAKTGTYKVSWMGFRNSTSGTNGSQLYIGNTAYGSANTTFVRSYGQSVVLTGVSLTQGQTVTVYARSRNTSYYMGVGNLIIEEV